MPYTTNISYLDASVSFNGTNIHTKSYDKFTFEYQASNICKYFIAKDYPFKLIDNEFRNVCHIDRDGLLKYSNKTDTNDFSTIHFIQQFKYVTKIYGETAENLLKGKLFKIPPIVAYRQPPNLRHIMVYD